MKAIIVGGGLAGLASTWALEKHGYECTLLEASDKIGGRMRSTQIEEYIVDEGFHVLHTAYPTLERWFDLKQLELAPMNPATSLITPSTGKIQTLGDPFRSPSMLFPSLLTSGPWNALRMLRWRLKSKKRDLERSMDQPTTTMDEGFKSMGFSQTFRERFLHPLFAGITLDELRRERTSFASFTWSAMSHGEMTMPKNGIQAVPQQLYDHISQGTIRYKVKVTSISESEVRLEHGEKLKADLVVIATPQHVANIWLGKDTPTLRKQTATFVFECDESPISKPRLLLNRDYGEKDQHVLHVHVPTLLHQSKRHLVVATVLGETASKHQEEKVQNVISSELRQWFGQQTNEWRFLTSTYVDYALPTDEVMGEGRERLSLIHDGVYYVGDHTMHPSVHGTLRSVERLLDHLNIPLPLHSQSKGTTSSE